MQFQIQIFIEHLFILKSLTALLLIRLAYVLVIPLVFRNLATQVLKRLIGQLLAVGCFIFLSIFILFLDGKDDGFGIQGLSWMRRLTRCSNKCRLIYIGESMNALPLWLYARTDILSLGSLFDIFCDCTDLELSCQPIDMVLPTIARIELICIHFVVSVASLIASLRGLTAILESLLLPIK